MYKFKFLSPVMAMTALCLTFSACHKSDDDEKAAAPKLYSWSVQNYNTSEVLTTVDTFSVTSSGNNISSVRQHSVTNDSTLVTNFEYTDSTMTARAERQENGATINKWLTGTIGKSGYLEKFVGFYFWAKDKNLKTDLYGHCVYSSAGYLDTAIIRGKDLSIFGEEKLVYNYDGDNKLTRYTAILTGANSSDSIITDIAYTGNGVSSPIVNKGNLFFSFVPESDLLGFTPLMGKTLACLPVTITRKSEIFSYEWTLNNDGLPVKCVRSSSKGGKMVTTYRW